MTLPERKLATSDQVFLRASASPRLKWVRLILRLFIGSEAPRRACASRSDGRVAELKALYSRGLSSTVCSLPCGVQYFAKTLSQIWKGKRFFYNWNPRLELRVGIAGNVDGNRAWTVLANGAHQIRPAHARHDDVCQNQVNTIRILPGSANGLVAICCIEDRVAFAFQVLACHGTNSGFVLDQQYRLARQRRRHFHGWRLLRNYFHGSHLRRFLASLLHCGRGQENPKGRSPVELPRAR